MSCLRFKTVVMFCWLSLVGVVSADEKCEFPFELTRSNLGYVVDGDTIVLKGGRKLRLIGVNTPELGKKGKASEPFAVEAKKYVQDRLSGGVVRWRVGEQSKDRYKRTLAYVFDERGQSLSAGVIENGLGFRVVVAPNVSLQDCFMAAESVAVKQGLGVWSVDRWRLSSERLSQRATGFRLISGRVESISHGGGRWWIELSGSAVLSIAKESQGYFSWSALRSGVGQELEVRGWLRYRKLNENQSNKGWKPFVMDVSHPYSLRFSGKDSYL